MEAVRLDFGGWDTHNYEQPFEFRHDQGNPQFGTLFFNLRPLAAHLTAFFHDLDTVKLTGGKTMMDRVTVVVMSEFGRTVNEHGVAGTDHGQDGVMLFLGKNVNGGRSLPTTRISDLMDAVEAQLPKHCAAEGRHHLGILPQHTGHICRRKWEPLR